MSGKARTFRASNLPTTQQLEKELLRTKFRKSYLQTLWNTISILITVAAIAILVAVLLLPVLRIYGSSMYPTLAEGDLMVSLKGSSFETGDVVAFYYNNKILVKRVIASSGDWVDIDEDGYVYVNNVKIDEPYIDPAERAFGDCNITLPYQVPESRLFVMGDNRSTSVDSRNTAVGCIAEEQIVGKIYFRIWPIGTLGVLN